MALKKKLLTNNIEAEYWRINGLNISITGSMCQVFLIGYKTDIERYVPIHIASRNYTIKKDEFKEYIDLGVESNWVSNVYEYLKNKVDDFKDAEDI